MAAKELPSQEALCQLLDYNADKGTLIWRYRPAESFSPQGTRTAEWCYRQWVSRFANRPAFTAATGRGYLRGKIGGSAFMAHRIIWKMVTGDDPEQIDHINGDRSDNRIANLRAVTGQQNVQNKARYARNATGVTGIAKARSGMWVARISANGDDMHIGTFMCIGQAIRARKEAERRIGYHVNHGRAA